MSKRHLKMIYGGKEDIIKNPLYFVEGYVTNTRLMGVIGLKITWKTDKGKVFKQFFHMDAEEYGIDDYKSLVGSAIKEEKRIIAKMMGGLGGQFVEVTQNEAIYLIQKFSKINETYHQDFPECVWEYDWILKKEMAIQDEEKEKLYEKICEKLQTPSQLIHYFIMRTVGMDHEGKHTLCDEKIDYSLVQKPSTLLKNRVEKESSSFYLSESLIEENGHYKMVISEIEVLKVGSAFKIVDAKIRSSLKISSKEAAFALSKKEYMLVYNVIDMEKVLKTLDDQKPHAMKNGHTFGYLYTEFYPHNEHVNRKTFYLSEDVYAVYYVTTANQLVVTTYHEENIDRILKDIEKLLKKSLEFEECLDLDQSLLYAFVESDHDNIFDFLDDES